MFLSLDPFVFPFFLFPNSLSITIVSPANKHRHTPPHDVEPSSLFFNKPGTLSCKRTSPLR